MIAIFRDKEFDRRISQLESSELFIRQDIDITDALCKLVDRGVVRLSVSAPVAEIEIESTDISKIKSVTKTLKKELGASFTLKIKCKLKVD